MLLLARIINTIILLSSEKLGGALKPLGNLPEEENLGEENQHHKTVIAVPGKLENVCPSKMEYVYK